MSKPPVVVTGGVGIGGRPPVVGGRFGDAPVDFDREAFDVLLAQKGYLVTWEKAAFCPNVRDEPAPFSHDISCTICDGTGFVFFGSCDTEMLIQSVRLNQQFWAQGRWDLGQVLVTARPGDQISYWDRITLRNGKGRFQELVRRGVGDVDLLKYDPLAIEYVAWVDRSGTKVEFVVGDDLQLAGGALTWGSSRRPDSGASYTVVYSHRPRYVVQELLHQHRESTVAEERRSFPVQAVAKQAFLVRDESRDPRQVEDQNPFSFGGR